MNGDNLNPGSALATPKEGTFNAFVTFPHPWPPGDETLASSLQFSDGCLRLFFESSGHLQAELIDNARNINRVVRSCKLVILDIAKATIFVAWGEVGIDIYIGLKPQGVIKIASLLNSSDIPGEINIHTVTSQGYTKDFLPKNT
jgi:hypothetical protein